MGMPAPLAMANAALVWFLCKTKDRLNASLSHSRRDVTARFSLAAVDVAGEGDEKELEWEEGMHVARIIDVMKSSRRPRVHGEL